MNAGHSPLALLVHPVLAVARPVDDLAVLEPELDLLLVKRQWNGRLWRRLARAPGAEALGAQWPGPSGRGPPRECRAARGHQARPEEPQEPSSGAAKGVITREPCWDLLLRVLH